MSCKSLLFSVLFTWSVLPALAADKIVSPRPDGTGDPDATTCRPPQPQPSSRFLGPEVCKTNSQWALLRKNNEDISADGSQVIPDPKNSTIAPSQCSVSGGGASAGGGGMPVCH
jgi:hypothetical protein